MIRDRDVTQFITALSAVKRDGVLGVTITVAFDRAERLVSRRAELRRTVPVVVDMAGDLLWLRGSIRPKLRPGVKLMSIGACYDQLAALAGAADALAHRYGLHGESRSAGHAARFTAVPAPVESLRDDWPAVDAETLAAIPVYGIADRTAVLADTPPAG